MVFRFNFYRRVLAFVLFIAVSAFAAFSYAFYDDTSLRTFQVSFFLLVWFLFVQRWHVFLQIEMKIEHRLPCTIFLKFAGVLTAGMLLRSPNLLGPDFAMLYSTVAYACVDAFFDVMEDEYNGEVLRTRERGKFGASRQLPRPTCMKRRKRLGAMLHQLLANLVQKLQKCYFIYCCRIPYEPCSLPNEVLQDIVLFFSEEACHKFIDTSELFAELVGPQVKMFNDVFSRRIQQLESMTRPLSNCVRVARFSGQWNHGAHVLREADRILNGLQVLDRVVTADSVFIRLNEREMAREAFSRFHGIHFNNCITSASYIPPEQFSAEFGDRPGPSQTGVANRRPPHAPLEIRLSSPNKESGSQVRKSIEVKKVISDIVSAHAIRYRTETQQPLKRKLDFLESLDENFKRLKNSNEQMSGSKDASRKRD
uniref:Uncharacterized protein n=1 Tax=Ditylenchus dipsaci TaxID=166011 RepID=A0A915EML1_9BILA